MDAASIIPALPDSSSLPDAFDYGGLPGAVADRQRERAGRIVRGVEALKRRTVEAMGEIGHELLAAQAEMDHGTFLPWVEGATGLSKSSAYRFMDIARAFGAKLPTVGSLPPAVVQTLAAKTTPEPVRAAVLRRIEAGETIAPAAILDEVREARESAKATAAAERETARRAGLTDEQRDEEDALRAKGEKGRVARERKEAREREARQAERQREKADARAAEAEARESAAAFIDMVGADRVAVFLAQHASGVGMVRGVMDARRARATPAVQIQDNDIYRGAALFGFLNPEDRPRIEALAQEIERDGLREAPVVVRRDGGGSWQPWQIIDGEDTFRALHDVLGWRDIPVHVVPPIDAVVALDASPPAEVSRADNPAALGAAVTLAISALGDAALDFAGLISQAGADAFAAGVREAVASAAAQRGRPMRLPTEDEAQQYRRGGNTGTLHDILKHSELVTACLPTSLLSALEEEAWREHTTPLGKVAKCASPAEWVTAPFPQGLNGSAQRVRDLLAFAAAATRSRTQREQDFDRTCHRTEADRLAQIEEAIAAFDAAVGDA